MLRFGLTGTAALALSLFVGGAHAGYVFQDVVDPVNPAFTQVLGINNAGTIVGYGNQNNFNGFSATAPYGGGQFTRENFPGSSGTQEVGISGTGTSVGFYVDAAGGNHGFSRAGGGVFSTIDAPGTAFTQILGINKSGAMAVGYSSMDAAGATLQRSFIIAGASLNTFTYIDSLLPANVDNQATGINDAGAVVGFLQNASGAFSGYEDVGGVITLIDAPGAVSTQTFGINDLGEIVGSYVDAANVTHGFLEIAGVFTTLDPTASVNTTINGINDQGQLVGFYTNAAGLTVGFVGQPNQVSEPGAFALTAMALMLMVSTRRRLRG